MIQKNVGWDRFKAFVDDRNLSVQLDNDSEDTVYELYAIDGTFQFHTVLERKQTASEGSDQEDFEDNYLSSANRILDPLDYDGSSKTTVKICKTGWHYEPRDLDFCTSVYNSLYNKKHDGGGIDDGTDYGDAGLKFYKSDDSELYLQQQGYESESEAQFQTRLDADCVKTILDWQPTYDMQLIAGQLMISNPPTNRAYLWVILAPDLTEAQGGSVPFAAGGWNLKFLRDKSLFYSDGKAAKFISYDPVYNTNKIRLIGKHDSGQRIDLQMIYEHFKA